MAPAGNMLEDYSAAQILIAGGVILYLAYLVGSAVYNLYFHPLAGFPGPKLWRVSKLPSIYSLVVGRQPFDIAALHQQYGDFVRVAPDTISVTHPDVQRDVNVYKTGKPHFHKDPIQYIAPPNGVRSIHSALDDANHTRQRRLLAHAFSEKSLREQEGLIQSYVDMLIDSFRAISRKEGPEQGKVDMVRWLNYTTFDLIGDLTFGESFHCLEDGAYHPWVAIIFEWMRGAIFLSAIQQFPVFEKILMTVIPKKVLAMRQDHFNLSCSRMDSRLATKTERPDFVQYLLKHSKEGERNVQELHSNSEILIIAGSETTATALSGCFYYLCLNPSIMQRITTELRTAITSPEDLTITNILKLEYMEAVLNEAMRIYPPVPGDLSRLSPKGGLEIGGRYIPENTRASVVQWAIHHSATNFKDPETFAPERWLPESGRYAGDKLQAFQPFSVGPRNCIGKNLAYAEMRLLLSKILWNFDIELCDDSRNWTNQRIFMLWEKPPLNIKLTERKI